MSGNVITFGKYKGQDWEVVKARDPSYIDWLMAQPGFKERNPTLVQMIVNNFQTQEVETPEHNFFQAQFLDPDVQMALLKHPAVGVFRQFKSDVRRHEIEPHIEAIRDFRRTEEAAGKKAYADFVDATVSKLLYVASMHNGWNASQANAADAFELFGALGIEIVGPADTPGKLKVSFEGAPPEVVKRWPEIASAFANYNLASKFDEWRDGTLKAKRYAGHTWSGFSYDKQIKDTAQKLRKALKRRRVTITHVQFERRNWDVTIEGNFGTLLVELKVSMADDYPAVLRQIMKRDRSESGYNPVCLIREYNGVGATYEQVKKIFAASKITLLREEG